MEETIWYKISANKLALKHTLLELGLTEAPSKSDGLYKKFNELYEINLAKARGVKYGVDSYSEMYMVERERVLGDWQSYFISFCNGEDIDVNGSVIVAGINDGQEVGFLRSKSMTGVDISREAIKRGEETYPHIHFVIDDLTKFLAEEDSFDTYLSLRTLHFFKDAEIELILSNAYKFLKNQGKIVISIPGGFLTEEGEIIFGQKVDNNFIDKEKPMKDSLKIEALVKAANFSNTKIVNSKIELFIIGIKGEPL